MKFLLFNLLLLSAVVFAEVPQQNKIINDAWYTMQTGSLPWGYYHEVIEERAGRLSYRYDMKKKEKGGEYHENIGALSELDLTPIAFNLSKKGQGATETINGNYQKEKNVGVMNIEIQGARVGRFKRYLSKDTILEVFFPLWLKQHWLKLKPGFKSSIKILAEDPTSNSFLPKTARFEILKTDTKENCLELKVELDTIKSLWCITNNGALVRMDIKDHQVQVRKVASEKDAKIFFGEKP